MGFSSTDPTNPEYKPFSQQLTIFAYSDLAKANSMPMTIDLTILCNIMASQLQFTVPYLLQEYVRKDYDGLPLTLIADLDPTIATTYSLTGVCPIQGLVYYNSASYSVDLSNQATFISETNTATLLVP